MPRPELYKPEYNEQVFKLALLGANQEKIADFFKVERHTITRWKTSHPDFAEAWQQGTIGADMQVAAALLKRATGYEYEEEQAIKIKGPEGEEVKVVKVKRHMPPTDTSIIFYLKNRISTRKDWREIKQAELDGDADPNAQPPTLRVEFVTPQGVPAPTPGDNAKVVNGTMANGTAVVELPKLLND